MLKKALLAGLLGVVLVSGSAFAGKGGSGGGSGGGSCPGGFCEVTDPVAIEYGYDIKVDLDLCLDFGNLNDDFTSAQAVIYQEGMGNTAGITQNSDTQLAGIVQIGDSNIGYITQSQTDTFALEVQVGNSNEAYITQSGFAGATAVIGQFGDNNVASITQ